MTISSFLPGDPPLTGVQRLDYERSIVSPHATRFGWRSIFNALWPLAAWSTVVYLTSTGRLPLIAGVLLSALSLQALYMPVHEAVHRTISAGRPRLVWIDRLIGSVCAFMLSTSFVDHRHGHQRPAKLVPPPQIVAGATHRDVFSAGSPLPTRSPASRGRARANAGSTARDGCVRKRLAFFARWREIFF